MRHRTPVEQPRDSKRTARAKSKTLTIRKARRAKYAAQGRAAR